MNTRLSLVARVLAVPALAALADAQVLVPTTFADGHDFDLADGQCDADPVLAGAQCTLRAAFQHAQAVGGAWTIQLGSGTYSLTRVGTDTTSAAGDLDVFSISSLVVQGAGPTTVIDAAGLSGGGGPDRVLQLVAGLPPTSVVELRDLTLRGGRAGGLGGGGVLHEGGRLVLVNVTVDDCQAASSSGSGGGGLRTNGEVSISGGSFQNCVAGAPLASGGALLAKSGAVVTVGATSFQGNSAGQSGGGLRVDGGASLTISSASVGNNASGLGGGMSAAGVVDATATFFLGNTATGSGGGIAVANGGFVTLDASTLDNNVGQTGGVNVLGGGTLVARDTTFRSNRATTVGGGVFNGGVVDLLRCTLSGNSADGTGGGGIYHLSFAPAPSVVTLCTISGNRAPNGSGGGILVAGPAPLEVSATTLVHGAALVAGAGLFTDPGTGAPAVLKSSLLAHNRLLNGLASNAAGIPPAPAGPNLDSDGTCGFLDPCLSGTTFLPLDPRIAPLVLNGGITETHALLGCSPAIDAGDCTTIAGIPMPTDQRLAPRWMQCDLGSFEAQPGTQTWEIVPFCFGTPTACPCGIGGAPGHGCPNSVSASGALLTGTGIARVSCDTVVMSASSMPNSSALLFQGTSSLNGGLGIPFGDGLRCAGGPVIRLGVQIASGGAAAWPAPGDPPLSAAGVVPAVGGDRFYQVWYRNAAPAYCTAATFNLTNGVRVYWCP